MIFGNLVMPCAECETLTTDYYMVHDELWQSVTTPDERFLCLACLEQRIGRPLVIDDFTPYPVNDQIRLVYQLGGRDAQPPKPE